MGHKLVIVESPAKAKTINKILGSDYVVKSSVGHVRDLPVHSLGVDIEHDFAPKYEVLKSKKKVISELKQAAKSADVIILAPDPDREGEAIAWHLQEILKEKSGDVPIQRVQYNEITPRAVKAAFETPGDIDMARVDAQQARRILDRIVGYKVSPVLWRKIKRGLSAGRVQSVALRLVCEREQEIRDFVPKEFWILGATVRKLIVPLTPFLVRLMKVDGKKILVGSEDEATSLRSELEGRSLKVNAIQTKDVRKRPFPPHITSTLQQAGSSHHGFAPQRTMGIAQKLYEGIELGGEPVGLITYMRTDSFNISQDALQSCRDFVQKTYGDACCPEKPNFYKSGGGAQEAHEAIRPTDVSRTPASLKGKLGAPEWKVYKLIWDRFVASQMTPAVIQQRTVRVEAVKRSEEEREFLFHATTSDVTFKGYMEVTGDDRKKDDERVEFPSLTEGEPLECLEWHGDRKETKPPNRYSEAALVGALKSNGVGRPSTYAAIIGTLNQRSYVKREKRSLSPTELGDRVNALLVEKLGDLFNVEFTAHMEESLDAIEHGRQQLVEMLQGFYGQFEQWMKNTAEPPADSASITGAIALLKTVQEWAPPVKRGRRTYSDEKFCTSVHEQFEKDEKPVTQRQLDALLRMVCRYKEQIEGVEAFLQSIGQVDLLTAPETQPPKETTKRKLELICALELDDSARKFAESLRGRVDGGRSLTEAQLRALNSMVLGNQGAIEDFDAIRAELEVPEESDETDEESGVMLEAMESVSEWNEPVKRGKRVFDDAAFFASLRDQYTRRRSLSPRQKSALKRMMRRYKDQIPDYEQLAETLDIKEKKPS